MTQPWVVIPTYNEGKNIEHLISKLFTISAPNLSILVVDDNSPDGTSQIVKRLQPIYPRLYLETRPNKAGLGRAYIHGFQYALDQGADHIVQMDADFSHDPNDVPKLLQSLSEHDLVIGSRYVHGISVINWPLRRLLLSTSANVFSGMMTGLPYKDITGGFRAWRGTALQDLNWEKIQADGYGFQIVMLHQAWKKNLRITEVPIIFTERRQGQSKMSRTIMWEALWLVLRLRLFG